MKKINKKMTIAEVLENYPETTEVLQKNLGMCTGCPAAAMESLELGAHHHGKDIKKLVADLNGLVEKSDIKK